MSKPVALYYDILQYRPENLALLERHFDLRKLPSPSDDTVEALSDVEICFAPLGYRFDKEKIQRCPRLLGIVTNTTGVPHIDLKAAAARNIAVISLKDEQDFLRTITPTAEHAWGLLLALMRRTPWAHRAVLDGTWNRRPFGATAMLSRLGLGVVGYGRLGRLVARYGRAFGMQVRFFDHNVQSSDDIADKAETLTELVSWADVISLHVPANESTHKMINRGLIARFKAGSWLVNTARGEVLDEQGLLDALQSGRLAGAALDVLDGEFAPDFQVLRHPLVEYARHHDNLLLTPHIGGSTLDAWGETERRVIEMAIAHVEEAVGS
jgi:phosphoglycerate dehydrogenase-like enzyme